MKISQILHPDYRTLLPDWRKWRLTFESGRQFINTYLQQYSKREEAVDFRCRKAMTYCPAFSKSAVNDVINSIYQRMADIKRLSTIDSYNEAVKGLGGGVDLQGSSMSNFMGQKVLPELVTMKKVGIYVDMPELSGETMADTMGKRPYLYFYNAEDICSWSSEYVDGQFQYTNVLLKDYIQDTDKETGLVVKTTTRYRRIWRTDTGVKVAFYKSGTDEIQRTVDLKLDRIPFINLELSASLMTDIADYQIALLNLDSSDLAYLFRANFPFYVEEYDPRVQDHLTDRAVSGELAGDNPDDAAKQEITVGVHSGRRYPKGTKPPQFIHPSAEPLTAAMAKEEQIKNEIRMLLNITLSNVQPTFASAESKNMDQRSLESGLSAIGLTMEYGEREILKIWSQYLGKQNKDTVNYPTKYSLKSEQDRRDDCKQLKELLPSAPSKTCKREIAKQIATTLLEHKVSDDVLQVIFTEIDSSSYIDGTVMDVVEALNAGLVTEETASDACGYEGKKEVPKAREQHAERLARIAEAQTPKDVAGVPATNTDPTKKPNPGGGRPTVKKKEGA